MGSPNCPTASNSKLPAIEGESSNEVAANNVAMHTAKQAFSPSESGEMIRYALQYQMRRCLLLYWKYSLLKKRK